MTQEIASLIGAISGSLSLLMLIYLAGVWKGKVDNHIKVVDQEREKYSQPEMYRMIKTLWDAYVIDPLHCRPGISQHHSPVRLTEIGLQFIPVEFRDKLDSVVSAYDENIVTGYVVSQLFPMDELMNLAEQNKQTIQETIAILSCYLKNKIEDRRS